MPLIFENTKNKFAEHVLPLEDFRLFADIESPVLTEEVKSSVLKIAEAYAETDYEPILAHTYMIYEKTGNRSVGLRRGAIGLDI